MHDGLALVGKEIIPITELLPRKRQESPRQPLQQPLIQGLLKLFRKLIVGVAAHLCSLCVQGRFGGDGHHRIQPTTNTPQTRNSEIGMPWSSIRGHPSSPATVGHRSTCRTGRSMTPGFSTAVPNAIIHVERVDSASL